MMIRKNTLLLTAFFLCTALLAQNSPGNDSLAAGKQSARQDTLVKPVKASSAPRKDTRPLGQRLDLDFNTGFWANTQQVYGEFMLLLSYRFPKTLRIGTGPTYIFNYQRESEQNLNGWGGKVFANAQLLKFFYLWTEYQGISNQYISGINTDKSLVIDKEYVDSWFFGAGLNIRMGRRLGFNVSVLYDILHNSHSPYPSATTYRIGFGM